MKASELAKRLEEMVEKYGDRVVVFNCDTRGDIEIEVVGYDKDRNQFEVQDRMRRWMMY